MIGTFNTFGIATLPGKAHRTMTLCFMMIALVASLCAHSTASAASRSRPFRIGALTTSWGPTPMIDGLRDGLQAFNYRDGKDFVIGVRFTQGDFAVLPDAAHRLVDLGVDLLFVGQAVAAKAAMQASPKVPIVFAAVSDPIGAGLIRSFAHPGGNITGVSDLGLELGPKRLDTFRELIPALHRVLFPYEMNNPDHSAELQVYRNAARSLGITLVEQPLKNSEESKKLFADIGTRKLGGILAPRCCFLNIPGLILEAASKFSLPTMYRQAYWVEQGALASYGPDYYASGRQAARLVDKIFKGEKPSEIPVETNPNIEFAINRKIARALKLAIRPEILFRAHKIVD